MIFNSMRRSFKKSSNTTIAGLDIGTSKVSCAIARIEADASLNHLGHGFHASRGLRGGTIVDMESLQDAVAHAVQRAEEMAGEIIDDAYVSVSPGLCHSRTVRVDLAISGHPVDEDDIKKITQQAINAVQKNNTVVVHTIPLSYEIDGVGGIREPRGMFGDQLRAKIHLLQSPKTPLRNLSACVERSHLDVSGFVNSVYASGLATLVEDELDLGVTLIDMGAGSTSLGLFFNGKLAYVDHVPIGGGHVTSDIARCFSTPLIQAERLKTLYGSALVSPADGRESIIVPQIGDEAQSKGCQITKAELTQVIRPRIEEIFENVKANMMKSPAHKFAGRRLVLTGGASQLSGVPELASLILNKQARIAKPLFTNGLPEAARVPGFSNCMGLLLYGQEQLGPYAMLASRRQDNSKKSFGRLGLWLKENF